MKFIHYISLTPSARKAIDKGTGKYGKFAVVDGKYIAALDSRGQRSMPWVLVIRGGGPPIVEVPANKATN